MKLRGAGHCALFLASLAAAAMMAAPAVAAQAVLAPQATAEFHASRDGGRVWASDRDFAALLEAIRGLEAHGLDPAHYRLAELEALAGDRAGRDIVATDAWFSAAAHMLYGKLDPVSVEPDWTAARRDADLPGALGQALRTGAVAGSLERLAPKQPGYGVLVAEYGRLLARADETPLLVPAGPSLKPDMTGPRVAALQARLAQLRLLPPDAASAAMDAATVAAVQAFQAGQGLDDDGIVGPATLAALNRGVAQQLEALRVNLERWRWLPDDLGRRHLRANIAGFDVTAWEDGRVVRTHLTIVGRLYRKTPVFSDAVRYVVLNPWWETPPSLARIDKLPLFRKDPGAVQRLGFQIINRDGAQVPPETIDWQAITPAGFPFRIRQAPGEQNALGQVKIMFPNRHNVYLHDTPTRGLFSHRQRAFSSGCIRTQDPLALTAWLLSETRGWDRAEIDRTLATGKETRVNLAEPVPVHILYFTVVMEPVGTVRYLDDIYARDAAVLAGLKAAASRT